MHILFLSRWFPYPIDNGSKLRITSLIQTLARRHRVHLIAFAEQPPAVGDVQAVRQYAASVAAVPYRAFDPRRPAALAGFLSARPRSVIDTFSAPMQAAVAQARRDWRPALVIASEIDMAVYAAALRPCPLILEDLEVTPIYEPYLKAASMRARLRAGLSWWKLCGYIRWLARRFDAFTVASEVEQKRVLAVASPRGGVALVPNGVHLGARPAGAQAVPDTLIYAGSLTYRANFEAVDYFLRDIFPLIRAQRPAACLAVTGKLDGVRLDRLPHDDQVRFTGCLDDVRPLIAGAWASVVPLRSGGGTRLKVLESLALGTPVVSTSKGAEGLDLRPGRDLLIADEPAEFAGAVVALLDSPELRRSLSRHGRQAVEARYNWDAIGEGFCAFAEQISAQAGAAPPPGRPGRLPGVHSPVRGR